MKAARLTGFALLLTSISASAVEAGNHRQIEIAAGPLDVALARFAQATGVDVGATDSAIALVRSRGVRGRLSPRSALDRLLAGTGYRAVAIDATSFRIERSRRAPSSPVVPARPQLPPDPEPVEAIIVEAGKRRTPLLHYSGSVAVIEPWSNGRLGSGDARDIDAISGTVPILQSTDLGAGRNKLFVRGIADSSFVGPTRSTAAVYLGEAQLGYNGADPNLNLYDVERIEILEGPQGALYGAGSIGGIVRIMPRQPKLDRIEGSVLASATATQHGDPGHELAAMWNLPIIGGIAALRVVGYATSDGGYIDDPSRRRRDINRNRTTGGRATLRIAPGHGWTIDLGVVAQENRASDSQYTVRGQPPLSRASTIAQPFEGDFRLGQFVVRKAWDDGLQLVNATAVVRHHSDDRFDATNRARPAAPLAYDSHDRNALFTQELRLSRSSPNGNGWLLGLSYIDDKDRIERELGPPGRPQDITGVINRSRDLSAFGEDTLMLGSRLSISAGGRLTLTRTDGDPTFVRRGTIFVRGRTSVRFTPMAGASLALAPKLALFVHHGTGFRTGGLAVAPGIGRVANFTPDRIHVSEAGARLERRGELGLSATAAFSYARWTQIQADLVDRRGFPYTTNIGNGRIKAFETTADWIPFRGLQLSGALFLNRSNLHDPVLALLRQKGDELADTPRVSADTRISYMWGDDRSGWSVRTSARYTGRSYVGFGPMLNVPQGGYVLLGAGAGWRYHRFAVDLDCANLSNSRSNRFSLGNPFGVADRNQMTPLRPRSLRLTLSSDL